MNYTTILFDLDDTLYPSANGVWSAIRERMGLYMTERLQLPAEQVPLLRRRYFETYGTTLRGLQIHYRVDSDEYLDYVHDLPLQEMIRPDPALRGLLLGLPQRRIIFTNADDRHAARVLAVLGLQDCFEAVIDVRAMGFLCKPEPGAYAAMLRLAGIGAPEACVYLDDSPRNLAPARQLGMCTVLVGHTQPDPAAVHVIQTPHDLPRAMPELWR